MRLFERPMASAPALLRDSHALLDPSAEKSSDRSRPINAASFHVAGGRLLQAAQRDSRREAAAAAVEVFREATQAAPAEPSLHNSLGASLLALARFESHAAALQLLEPGGTGV